MARGEFGRWYPPQRAVRSCLVVVPSPGGDQCSGMGKVAEVMVVQALVAELPVEALDVGILRRFACGDQLQIDALAVGPAIQRPARKLRPLVGANRLRQSAELSNMVQHARYVPAGDPEVHRNVQTLSGEVIDHRQTLDATAT